MTVLLVNERTLLPVLMPLAPAVTLTQRSPAALTSVLDAHDWNMGCIEAETAAMHECSIIKTANRSLLGMLNEFTFMAEVYRERLEHPDLLSIALELADTPCKPIKVRQPGHADTRDTRRRASAIDINLLAWSNGR
ncbi:DUF6933 domain-containing protein [Thiomonas sp.]